MDFRKALMKNENEPSQKADVGAIQGYVQQTNVTEYQGAGYGRHSVNETDATATSLTNGYAGTVWK
jgi:hypothetical protein